MRKKINIQTLISIDFNEYLDEQHDMLYNCNCCTCNPYYGDVWEYFVLQDNWKENIKSFE